MTAPSIAYTNGSTNGHPAVVELPAPTSDVALAYAIDRLHSFRAQLVSLQAQERELSSTVTTALRERGITTFDGTTATAALRGRASNVVDPRAFLRLTGRKGLAAVSISITEARRLLAGDVLAKITTTTQTSALYVEARS